MVTLVNDLQPSKALSPICFTESGISTLLKELQSRKTERLMAFIDFGMGDAS